MVMNSVQTFKRPEGVLVKNVPCEEQVPSPASFWLCSRYNTMESIQSLKFSSPGTEY